MSNPTKKPDPGPAAGAREEKANPSRREAAAWQVARLMELGDVVPRADLIELDGKEVAAIRLLDPTFKPLDEQNKAKEQLAAEVLAPYLADTRLHKWAVFDWVIGNPDRHGQNLLVDEKGRVALIDHGSAFCGPRYSPSTDKSSFIPYYLRAWGPLDFMQHDPQERMKFMPVLTRDLDAELRAWLESIDPLKLGHTIHRYGIDPKPALTRLQVLRDARGSLSRTVNALFAGAKV